MENKLHLDVAILIKSVPKFKHIAVNTFLMCPKHSDGNALVSVDDPDRQYFYNKNMH